MEKIMKHFLATHTCFSHETRRGFIEHSKSLTDRQMLEGVRTEKAQMLAHWMGKDEFFFCHWLAESEEAIHEALDLQGLNEIIAIISFNPCKSNASWIASSLSANQ